MLNCLKKYEVEFSDGIGFFSSDSKNGFGYTKNNNFKGEECILFNKSKTKISYIKKDNSLIFNNIKGSLFDLVKRYKIPKKNITNININGEIIYHKSSNIYRNIKNKKVILNLDSKKKIQLNYNITNKNCLSDSSYIRDEKDFWIIHIRLSAYEKMLCEYGYDGFIKNCIFYFQKFVIPVKINKYNHKLVQYLFLKPERRPIKNPILRRILNLSFIPIKKIKTGPIIFKSSFKRI